ncbi:hypothetical protein AB0M95_19610 [Sphaerisporangium sp. NPDC051017]|uniref:hypothetical protein n=1 Tax=Sphaerisporangium sp. NPDC051017 TaxID=3154636 RepID=UPI00342F9F91
MSLETLEFPGWKPVWRTDKGRWWTTRSARLTRAQRDAGCAATVSADDLSTLIRLHNELATVAEPRTTT